ncbi:prephenate dehydratase [Psychroflexus sp. YR1-1]|uniref:prephenate dehydratase n=1 Tax=Psychroflexus aurantiacus TaxID=2709310 RepID=A0A6B3R5T3_9FLAO|nr:prephenate dehydratase domain-containing protein [Psychroflexus aurantiacus]NEV92774.1 prephenate dehydratase [Psychroflexus aurantiacus]
MKKKIAIQGIKGSNHYKALTELFDETEVEALECNTFQELVHAVMTGVCEKAVMAIENSIAGSILPNYRLILDHKLQVTAEHYLNISHNLVALPGQGLADLVQVKSHQMALHQCSNFFSKYLHIHLIEDVDTALPAKIIAEHQLTGVGALVPKGSAELFQLTTIAEDVQNNSLNETRFVVVEKQSPTGLEVNKATIQFEMAHEQGSLAKVLNAMAAHDLNLSKIQSIPIPYDIWRYAFIVDVSFSNPMQFQNAFSELSKISINPTCVGQYKNGKS